MCAWTAPRTWVANEVVTAALFNAHVRDNLLALDQHAHSGSAGDGSGDLGSIDTITWRDQSASPATTGLMQRNGSTIEYYDGTQVTVIGGVGAANVGSVRKIGTGATDGAAGNHTHSITVESESEDNDIPGPDTMTCESKELTASYVTALSYNYPTISDTTGREVNTVSVTVHGTGTGAGTGRTQDARIRVGGTEVVTGSETSSGSGDTISVILDYLDTSPTSAAAVLVEWKDAAAAGEGVNGGAKSTVIRVT